LIKLLKYVAIGIGFGVVFMTPMFVYFWYDHTLWVQEMVEERFEDFREDDIDWSTVDPVTDADFDAEAFREQVRDVGISAISIWGTSAFREERYAYIGALADLQGALLQTPDATFNLGYLVTEAEQAQAALYEKVGRFTSNTLYAMRFTF
jgi:hypothetical protein